MTNNVTSGAHTSLKTRAGSWNHKKVRSYLKNAQTLQDTMLVAFHSSIGIPPRPWQTTYLTYRPYEYPNPNINILHGQVIIQNPSAKQLGMKEYSALWALPPQLSRVIVFYLGVIRTIEIRLLEILSIPTDQHKIYIFTRLTSTKRDSLCFRYSTSQLNEVLVSSELGLDPLAMRHVFIALFRRHHPHLLESEGTGISVVDDQSQHNRLTGDLHYSPDEIMRSTGSPITHSTRQLRVSHTLQAQYGMITPSSDIDPTGNRRRHALYVARHHILQRFCEYRIMSEEDAGWSQRAERVRELLVKKPFLFGTKARSQTLKFWLN